MEDPSQFNQATYLLKFLNYKSGFFIEAGANDCIFHDEFYEIHTNKDEIYDVKNIMEKEISNFISTEIEWVPINKIKLNQEDKEKMFKFLEILEEDDDVQNVFTNAVL